MDTGRGFRRRMLWVCGAVGVAWLSVGTSSLGVWSTVAPMPALRYNHTGAALNGLVHVMGGAASAVATCTFLTTHDVYDPATNTWAPAAPMSTPRVAGRAAVLNGLIYVAGGDTTCNQQTPSMEAYDPGTNTWTPKAPMPTRRANFELVALDGLLYAIGGNQFPDVGAGGLPLDIVEVYDPSAGPLGAWTTLPPMLHRRMALAAAAIDGRLYVAGGTDGTALVSAVDVYDPATGTWTAGTPIGVPRYGPAGTSVDGRFLVAGGWTTSGFTSSVEVYDPVTDTWALEASLPAIRAYMPAVSVNGRVYVPGGFDGITNTTSTTFELSDLIAPTTTATPFPTPNGNGWHNSDVNVTLQATDDGGVQSISYSLSGAQTDGGVVAGGSALVTVQNEGTSTLAFHATDTSGNAGPDDTLTIRIDRTPPLLGLPQEVHVTTPAGSGGAVVTFVINAWDALSGVAATQVSPLSSGMIFPVGSTHVSVTVFDAAGNAATGGFDVVVTEQAPVTLVSVSVSPSTATLNVGQGQNFQAIGHFSDGSTAILMGSGGVVVGQNPPSWHLEFVDDLNVSACATPQYPAPITFGGQRFANIGGAVNETWSPGTPVITATGTINATEVQLTLTCLNGNAGGTISAAWTGTRYEGTWSFDGSSGSVSIAGWSAQSAMPTPRFAHGAAAADGIVYVIGGLDGAQVLDSMDAYNPATNTWTVGLAPVPTPRNVAATELNGRIYAAGGQVGGGAYTGALEVYNPATNTWTTGLAPMPTPRSHHVVVADGTYLYALGGIGAAGQLSSVERYDPATNTWTALAPMPGTGSFFAAGVLNGAIVVVGAGGSGAPSAATDVYDIATNTWQTAPPMPAPRTMMTAAVANGGLFVIGGTVDGMAAYETWAFYPQTATVPARWVGLGSMPTARSQAAAAVVGDVVYATGGMTGGAPPVPGLAANEALSTPPSETFAAPGSSVPTAQWQSTNTFVASVNSNGFVMGQHPGQATIVAVASNGVSCLASSTCASVTVADTLPPTLNLPHNQTREAMGPSGASVSFFVSAFDNVDGQRPVTCSPPSGSTFPLGTTTVNCSASDLQGHTASGSFTVTVRDTNPPFLNIPFGNQTREATGPGGALVTYNASANDTLAGPVPITCSPASNTMFPFGQTTVTCSGSDPSGNTRTGSFTITVQDTKPPSVFAPSSITREATGAMGAAVSFSVSANDTVDGNVPVSCTPASGSIFPLGTTTVVCSASDTRGNNRTGSFTISVVDTTPPMLMTPGDITVNAVQPLGAPVMFVVSATDLVDGPVTVACTPASGSTFPIGATTATCAATDAHLNSASATLIVTVLGAPDILANLVSSVGAVSFQQASNLLQNALQSLDGGQTETACNQIAAFINQVQAQSGKSLTPEEAAALIQSATAARGTLGCQ